MFREALRRVVEGTDGAMAGILMDVEGIAVDSYSREDAGPICDIETVGAEVSVLVKSVQRASEMLEAGAAREVSFQSDGMTTLVRLVTDSYFLALAVAPGGNAGKGRYLLRVTAPRLVAELI